MFYNFPLLQFHWTKKKVSHFSALNSASLYIAIILLDKRNTFKDSIPCEVFHGSKTKKKRLVSYLFFSSYNSANFGNNMMSTCSYGLFWPDGGQKMAWLQVNSGTLSLKPYPHISFFLKTKIFFLCFQKKISVQRLCFFFSDWKWHRLWWEQCMHFYWYPTPWNKPPLHTNTAKQRFQKYPLWKAFWKDAFSVTLFTRYVGMVGQTKEKNLGFQTKMDTCGKASRFLIICIVLKESEI